MIPVAMGVLAGGATILGVKSTVKKPRVKKRRLVETLCGKPLVEDTSTFSERLIAKVSQQSPSLGAWLTDASTSVEKLDMGYQLWVKRRLTHA